MLNRFSKKWMELLLGTAFACLGVAWIDVICPANSFAQDASSAGEPQNEVTALPLNETRSHLQSLLEGGHPYLGFSKKFEIPLKSVLELYEKTGFQPLWFTKDKKTICAQAVIELLSHVEEEGLDPQDYEWVIGELNSYLKAAEEGKTDQSSLEDVLRADILLSSALLQYISDARGERLSPKKIDKELYLEKPKVEEAEVLLELMKNAEPKDCAWMDKIPPQNPEYQALKKILKELLEKRNKGEGPIALAMGPPLKEGMSGPRVLELRQALQSRGYGTLDSVENLNVFDVTLQDVVKAFQKDYGLDMDGVAGPQVQGILSKTIQDQIDQIIVTLERWRWMPANLGQKYILVNIPSFEAQTYDQGKLIFKMPIIVGKAYRETPVFYSQIINVIFNPSWNVPKMIAVSDKLPLIQKKGADYLTQKKIHVYQNGVEVNPHHIDWSHVSKQNFNFHFRQDPGAMNALGRIRFTIVSPFDVYMHGTPEQELFDKTKRTFSSGCIRLEDPVKMAEFVLGDAQKWSPDLIRAEVDQGKTETIPLKDPVAVYIQYFTVFVDNTGTLHILEDVYGQDKQILKALKSRRSQAP